MRLTKNTPDFLLCSDYYVPLNSVTLSLLQFYHEHTDPLGGDVVSFKAQIIDVTSALFTPTIPINTTIKKEGNTYKILIQGINNVPINRAFRLLFTMNLFTGANTAFISDAFMYSDCDNSAAIIPCIVDGQTYSSENFYLGEITGVTAYESWHTTAEKKYTPVVFLRNLSFNKTTSTIEYKKIKNKPLFSTTKKTYSLRCEVVPAWYTIQIMDIFAFGKVNLFKGINEEGFEESDMPLNKTYSFETYSDEVLDETDCCSFYRISATAYEENEIRLICGNTCKIVDGVRCNQISNSQNLEIQFCSENLVNNQIDITSQVMNLTKFDNSELGLFSYSGNSCWEIIYDEINQKLIAYYLGSNLCDNITVSYEFCGETKYLTYIFTEDCSVSCIPSVLNSITYSEVAPVGYTIQGQINSEVILQYSFDALEWVSIGLFPIGTSIFSNNFPTGYDFFVRVVGTCGADIISNIINYINQEIDCYTVDIFASEIDISLSITGDIQYTYIDCNNEIKTYSAANSGNYQDVFCAKSVNGITYIGFDNQLKFAINSSFDINFGQNCPN